MKSFQKLANLFLVFVLVATLSSYILTGHASATAGILDTRSITMTSSANAATNVKYTVKFNVGTTGNVGSMIIEFCSQDPIPGDSCTAPSSFNTNFASIGNPGSSSGITDFTTDTTNSTSKCLLLKRTAASVSAGTTVQFSLGNGTSTGITNPATTNTTFYARMLTYATTITTCSSSSPGTYVDAGGIAISTTAQLTITAKVQEQLSLCVYTGANCAAGGTALTLGDANGILSTAHSYTNINGKFDASTNAANGMNIFAQGTTLTSPQGNTIAAIGATATTSSTSNEQFGFCVATNGLGTVAAATPYGGGTGGTTSGSTCGSVANGQDAAGTATFAYDTSSTPNMTSVGGMKIAGSTGPSTTTTGTLAYLANIAVTTKAGVYTTTQTFIGIGSF